MTLLCEGGPTASELRCRGRLARGRAASSAAAARKRAPKGVLRCPGCPVALEWPKHVPTKGVRGEPCCQRRTRRQLL